MYKTEGIVLKKIDAGEAGAFFVMYTKDFGKIRAFAQGIKKENAKLKGHLEPLCHTAIQFVLGKNGERLTHASVISGWERIRSRFEKLKTASAIAYLVEEHCMPGERDDVLWETLLAHFSLLENSDLGAAGAGEFLKKFESSFFENLGYGNDTTRFPNNSGSRYDARTV